ncbi:MAG TPA: putative Ig domain-containing protein [Chthoniobacteraceae bacterium]|nr:putative Ig domain-containing protein [Chthoniobacteraceae bacterium]
MRVFLSLACVLLLAETPIMAQATAEIRTPPAAATPRINGARVFGARPGHPFFFHIAVTGERPISLQARGLPAGLRLDPDKGEISGTAGLSGTYEVILTARNAKGAATAPLRIVLGSEIALTPPMGWNSWNHFGRDVTQEEVKAAGDAMISSGLIDHGWTYINVDDGWQGSRGPGGVITGNRKFPGIATLGDYLHGRGLKFGIYTSPGPQTCAGFAGSRGHEAQDAATYAGWGVDYVKYDLCSGREQIDNSILKQASTLLPADQAAVYRKLYQRRAALERQRGVSLGHLSDAQAAELQAVIAQMTTMIVSSRLQQETLEANMAPFLLFGGALRAAPRDMIYSISSHGREDIWNWGRQVGANSWRTTYDIAANWKSISYTGFMQNGLAAYAGPGHWNDPDMLELGNASLSANEAYTHMSLWCMLSAPLLIGCDMTKMSDFTRSLFENDEVIAIDQDALGREGSRLKTIGTVEIWTKPLSGGALAVAFFNRGSAMARVEINPRELGLTAPCRVRDVWRQKDLPQGEGMAVSLGANGAEMFRLDPDRP